MSNIDPWMRRAAEASKRGCADYCHTCYRNCRDCAAEEIAAHAPPVEDMLLALDQYDGPAAAREIYNEWLKREKVTDGTR